MATNNKYKNEQQKNKKYKDTQDKNKRYKDSQNKNYQTKNIRHKEDHYQKIVPFIIFILALVLLFLLIQHMITILLGSVLLAYISYPVYKKLIKKIHNKTISILLSLFIIGIIILIPFSFLAFEVTQQGYYFYNSLSDNVAKGKLLGFGCVSADSKVCLILNQVETFSSGRLATWGLDKRLQSFLPILEQKITDFILSVPIIIAEIILALTIAFFIIKDWESILKQIVYLLPMRTKTTNKLVKEFGKITHTVVYAQLFVALIQGIVATIGFYIFGAPFPIILGVMIAFCSLIPTFGTAIIWIPTSLFLILSGYFSHDNWTLIRGIGLFLYGALIISLIDNILLVKIVRQKAKVHQIIVIIGVIGGASLFGVIGIFVGPIMLPLLITYFETFKERFM